MIKEQRTTKTENFTCLPLFFNKPSKEKDKATHTLPKRQQDGK
jgi:hypothetical protein